MSKWKIVKLRDAFDLQMGKTPSRNNGAYWNDGANKWVSIADIGSTEKYIFSTKETISNLGVTDSGIKTVPKDTVIMSFKLSIGKTCIVSEDMYTNEAVMAFINKGIYEIDNSFLFYLFKGKDWSIGTNKAVMGSTLNKATIGEVEIPIPPLNIQKQIAKTLDTASELLAMLKQQLVGLDNLIKSVFYDMFGDPVGNERGWETVTIGDIVITLTDYHANGSYEILKDNVELLNEPNYALMIRTTDLENNNYINNVKYITEAAYNFLEKSKVFGGEIIINKIGSAGNVYLMPILNRPVSLAMNQFLLRFHKNVNTLYVYYYLTTEFSKKNISERVRGAVTKTITKDAVRSIPFRLPPLANQNIFANIVAKIEEQKALVQKAIDETQHLLDSLMSQYFD